MGSLNSFVMAPLVALFSIDGIPLVFAILLLGLCTAILLGVRSNRYVPIERALAARRAALAAVVTRAQSDSEAQDAFSDQFTSVVDPALSKDDGRKSDELRRAWAEYKETIVDPAERPLRNTARPSMFFGHIGDDLRVLGWWSNIFVAMGLVMTFLGIVAALTKATSLIGGNSNVTEMQGALADLLHITAAKFWTSIAGVLSSILLRWFERRWRMKIRRGLAEICDSLERGLKYVPPQSFAADQLVQLREQTIALKLFNTELATAIGDQFEKRMQPMFTVMGSIETTLKQVKEGGFAQIGESVTEALSRSTGREMTALSDALAQMTQQFSGLHERIDEGGQSAGKRIEEAAHQFSVAASAINSTFAELGSRIDGMATKLTDQTDAAAFDAGKRFQELGAGFQEAAERNAGSFDRAASVLSQTAIEAGTSLTQAVQEAMKGAAADSRETLRQAFDEFGSSFAKEGQALASAVGDAAVRMERLTSILDGSTRVAGEQALRMSEASQSAHAASTALGKVAVDVDRAVAPVRDATAKVAEAVGEIRGLLDAATQASQSAAEEGRQMAEQMRVTSQTAEEAWRDYQTRFAGTDASLGQVLTQITQAVRDNADHLVEHVNKIDRGLSEAVTKLARQLDPIEDLAGALEDEIAVRRQRDRERAEA